MTHHTPSTPAGNSSGSLPGYRFRTHPSPGRRLLALAAALLIGPVLGCASSPLSGPVTSGKADKVRQLLESGVDPNGTDRKGRTLLELAILKRRADVVQLLVEKGADVNKMGDYGNAPIAWASERGNGEIAAILISNGADVNVLTRHKTPSVYQAVDRGHFDVAALLIEAGADVDAVGPKSNGTALHKAIEKNRPYLVQTLVAAGADLEAQNRKKQTTRDLAKALGRSGPILQALEGNLSIAQAGVSRPAPKRKTAKATKPRPTPSARPTPKPRPTPKQAAPPRRSATRDRTPPTLSGSGFIQTRSASVDIDLVVKDQSAVREVRIDGRRVVLDSDGRLSERRAVPEGNSLILVTAVDEWGNEASHEIKVARQIVRTAPQQVAVAPTRASSTPPAPAPPIPSVDFGRYHALVIGNNKYSDLPRLRTAVNDAISVSAILRDDYDYDVTTLIDATRSDVLQAFSKLRKNLSASDNLLVFYAGHGWLDIDADQGYWLPVDATRDSPVNWISNADISSSMRAMQANHVMVVADSCYSGKLTRGLVLNQKPQGYLERLAKKRARVVLTSGGIEPVEDGTGSHSVFAGAFIDALRENRGVLEGHELFQRIRRPVMLNTEQVPDYGDMKKAGHDGGDFLFVRTR